MSSDLVLTLAEPSFEMQVSGRDAIIDATDDDNLDLSTDDARACYIAMVAHAGTVITRDRLATFLATLDGVRLLDIKSTVGQAEDANNWRNYLGRADDLLALISAEVVA